MRSELSLAEVCELIVDCPHKTAPESKFASAYAVGTKAISNGRIQFEQARPVDKATYEQWIARATPGEGDLILCREAPVGPVARVPAHPPVCLGQRTVLLRANPEIIDPRYLMYALLAPTTQSVLRAMSEGSTVPHLNVADVRRFPIEVPSRAEQERVADVLCAMDDKVDSNRRLASLLEQLAATVFRARFVDFVGVEEFEESEIGPIPRGWVPGILADVAEVHRQLLNGASDQPYIGLDLMPRGSTILTEWRTEDAPTGQAARFEEGDILFGKLRPYFKKVGVAPIAGRCSTEILVLRPRAAEHYAVLLGHVASQRFIDHCVAVSRGTRMPRAEWKDAAGFAIAIPPTNASREFSEVVRRVYAMIRGLTHESRVLAEIRDALLPKLIAGEIRVPDTADPDEVIGPAAEHVAA